MSNALILVVEDDPILRRLVQRQLTKLGHSSEAVETGEEALARDHSDIALILMDIGLPGIDGCYSTQLIREIELKEKRRRVPIVALTAHSDRQKCLDCGMDDFVQKPALMADVKQILDKWLTQDSNGKLG